MDDILTTAKAIWDAIGPFVTAGLAVVTVGTPVATVLVNRRLNRAKERITRIEGDAALLELVEKSKVSIARLTSEAEEASMRLGAVLRHVDRLERYADEADRVINANRLRYQVRVLRPRLKGHRA